MIQIHAVELRAIIQEEIFLAIKAIDKGKAHDTLLSRKEAAKLLGIKPHTLAVWASQGRGPAPTKIGNCAKYKRSELERFINENTMPRWGG